MEGWFMMILHSIIIALILYFIMLYGFKQSTIKAENRSVLIGAIVLVYMLVFGHNLPVKINKNIL
jgi:uncharacterized membrane protein YhaH (DUF805 family)